MSLGRPFMRGMTMRGMTVPKTLNNYQQVRTEVISGPPLIRIGATGKIMHGFIQLCVYMLPAHIHLYTFDYNKKEVEEDE